MADYNYRCVSVHVSVSSGLALTAQFTPASEGEREQGPRTGSGEPNVASMNSAQMVGVKGALGPTGRRSRELD